MLKPVQAARRVHGNRDKAWDLRQSQPVSQVFGWDRGTPIDRRYISTFLTAHAAAIHGDVLEVGDSRYARVLGRNLGNVEILDVVRTRHATIIGNLETPGALPAGKFDCIIATQVLLLVFDLNAAIENLFAALRPGGVLLLTLPGISKDAGSGDARDYWRFTESSAQRICEPQFGRASTVVTTYGNVGAACAFLFGRAAEELSSEILMQHDSRYPVLIGVRATKTAD